MKVGILTFHFAHNYGAMIQAYALSRFINSKGFDCRIVDYRFPHIYRWVEKYSLKDYYYAQREDGFDMVRSLLRTLRYFPRLRQTFDKTWHMYEGFMKNYLPLSDRIYSMDLQDIEYDAMVVGSDQIWNSELTDGLQDVYFLNFGNKHNFKRISYAASSGSDDIKGSPGYIKATLSSFDHISCREPGLSDYCSSVTKADVHTVCDPIFLLSKEEWSEICLDPIVRQPYILVYGFNENQLFHDVIKSVAEKTGLSVVRIGKKPLPDMENERVYIESGPLEFLTLFKYAELVISNTFHGVSTSVVFNRPFIAVLPEKRRNRVVNVLRQAGLNNRIAGSKDDAANIIDSQVDYCKINDNLNDLICKSKKFIVNSLLSNRNGDDNA